MAAKNFNDASPPDLDLSVYDTESLRGFENTLEEAISILSKSPLARSIAQAALDADYVIVVESDKKTMRDDLAFVDHEQKLIFLHKQDDAEKLSLTLMHELTHISQHINANVAADIKDTPLVMLKKLLVMEADARAHEIAFAISLFEKHPALIDRVAEKGENHMVKALIDKIKPKLPDVNLSTVMVARFKAFYLQTSLREEREDALLSMLETLDKKTLQDETLFRRTEIDADIFERLDKQSIPYLAKHRDYIALENPIMSAIGKKSLARLETLEKLRHENPLTAKEAPWQAPVYKIIADPIKPKKPQL